MVNIRWGIIAAIFALFITVTLGIFSGVSFLHVFLRGLVFSAVFFCLGFGLRFVINNFFPEILFSGNESGGNDIERSGTHVNITLDSTGEYAVPELFRTPDGADELGNIDDLISGVFKSKNREEGQQKNGNKLPVDSWFDIPESEEGIDRKKEEGYNKPRGGQSVPFQETSDFRSPSAEKPPIEKPAAEMPLFTPSFGDDSGLEGLPDLDMMARAFSSTSGGSSSAQVMAPMPSMPVVSSAASAVSMFHDDGMDFDRNRNTGNKPQPLKGDFNPRELAKGISTILNKD